MTDPVSAHDLVVFVVPTHLGDAVERAVDDVVGHAGNGNTAFGWVAFDTRSRALYPPAPWLSGTLLRAHCTAPDGPTALAAGVTTAVDLAHQFIADHRDGLPVSVDLLAVGDARCHCDGAAMPEPGSGVIRGGIVLHDQPTPSGLPLYLRSVMAESWSQIGLLWTLLRQRQRVLRRPASMLG